MTPTMPLGIYAYSLKWAVEWSRDELYPDHIRQTVAEYALALLDCYEIGATDEFGRAIARRIER